MSWCRIEKKYQKRKGNWINLHFNYIFFFTEDLLFDKGCYLIVRLLSFLILADKVLISF